MTDHRGNKEDIPAKNEEIDEKALLQKQFDSWIKKVLYNLVKNEVRSYKRECLKVKKVPEDEISLIPVYDDYFKDDEKILLGDTPVFIENKTLKKALPKMGKRKQKVLEETILLGNPVRLVAKKLGLSEQIVSNYKYRALKELRNLMEKDSEE